VYSTLASAGETPESRICRAPLFFQGGGVRLKAGIVPDWLSVMCLSPSLGHYFLFWLVSNSPFSGAASLGLASVSEDRAAVRWRQSRRHFMIITAVFLQINTALALQLSSHVLPIQPHNTTIWSHHSVLATSVEGPPVVNINPHPAPPFDLLPTPPD
jgi:hypothetical protein